MTPGRGGMRSALFLDCIPSAGTGRTSGDLILVIPVTAALDFYPCFPQRRWNESDAADMAAALTARYGV